MCNDTLCYTETEANIIAGACAIARIFVGLLMGYFSWAIK